MVSDGWRYVILRFMACPDPTQPIQFIYWVMVCQVGLLTSPEDVGGSFVLGPFGGGHPGNSTTQLTLRYMFNGSG
jgi:hypothetical protein